MSEEQLNPAAQNDDSPDTFNALLWGAAVTAVISLLPYISLINTFCCLGIMIGGAVTIFQYSNQYQLTIRGGEGFKLGALAGLLGGMGYFIIFTALQVLFNYQLNAEETMNLMMALFGSDPQAREQIEESFRKQKLEGVTISNILIGLISTLIIYPIAGGIGGAIGAAVFRKGKSEPEK
jgi:hypothetical protein